jgi:elongator complex protein 6
LSELFDLPGAAPPPAPAALQIARTLPVRSPQLQVPQIPTSPKRSSGDDIKRLHVRGHGVTALDSLQKEILTIVENVRTQGRTDRTGHQKTEILLVIDQPDFLLAAMGTGQGIGASEMQDWLMGLEQVRRKDLRIGQEDPDDEREDL